MLLTSRRIAILGLMTAVSVILISLSGIVESNSLFFLVAASMIVGIGLRITHIYLGGGLFAASLILSLILAPNKFYCLTYSFLSIYLIGTEVMFEWIAKKDGILRKKQVLTVAKIIWFNLLYIPILLFLPGLMFNDITQELPLWYKGAALVVGQVFLLIFEYANRYVHIQLERKNILKMLMK